MIRLGPVLALLLLLLPAAAQAECTREERAAMARIGYNREQIDRLCRLGQDAFPPPAGGTATYCDTQEGFCPLEVPAPVGVPCTCGSSAGPRPGLTE